MTEIDDKLKEVAHAWLQRMATRSVGSTLKEDASLEFAFQAWFDAQRKEPPDIVVEAIAVLNRALAADPVATQALVCHRVPANQALLDDPTIQVLIPDNVLGMVGILNGILGKNSRGEGWIVGFYEYGTDKLLRFDVNL